MHGGDDRHHLGGVRTAAAGHLVPPTVTAVTAVPQLRQVVLDTVDARSLAEFYRQLLGLRYRPGDEPPAGSEEDTRGQDWLVLHDGDKSARIAFQQVSEL